jgi:DNA repair exonuclease SbcCD ATPase subunit
MSGASETLIPFAKQTASSADTLDTAGRSILGLLHRAAGMAEENSKHAIEVAQKLSDQLQAAEHRIRGLEADVKYFQERAERGEQWLSYISSEIEDKFLRAADARGAPARSSRPANGRN